EDVRARIARKRHENVCDIRAGRVRVAREFLLQSDRISELAKLRDDAIADDIVRRRTYRMRGAIAENQREGADCPRCGKTICRSVGRKRRRTTSLEDDD